MESTVTISTPPAARATSRAIADFPLAVGPTKARWRAMGCKDGSPMGPLLFGLLLGVVIGFLLGQRYGAVVARQLGNTSPPPTVPPVAPGAAAPIAAPNKRGRKAGLTVADFQPADDILDRL